MTGLQVAFQSMPRTGNSFLRRMIELCTGIYTGSDMNIDITQNVIAGNLAGEETVSQDNLCWITKTHWPMESPLGATKFSAQRCIAIVRNPTEVLPSMALLMNLMSHSLKTTVPVSQINPVWWAKFLKMFSVALNGACRAMRNTLEPQIPTFYVRYEDMCLDAKTTLNQLFCFLLEVPSLEGTVIEKRIEDVSSKG